MMQNKNLMIIILNKWSWVFLSLSGVMSNTKMFKLILGRKKNARCFSIIGLTPIFEHHPFNITKVLGPQIPTIWILLSSSFQEKKCSARKGRKSSETWKSICLYTSLDPKLQRTEFLRLLEYNFIHLLFDKCQFSVHYLSCTELDTGHTLVSKMDPIPILMGPTI